MSDEDFRDLINRYLDGEARSEDIERLRAEIKASPERRQEFEQERILHAAARSALRKRIRDAVVRDSEVPKATFETRSVLTRVVSRRGGHFRAFAAAACLGLIAAAGVNALFTAGVFEDPGNGQTLNPADLASLREAVSPRGAFVSPHLARFASETVEEGAAQGAEGSVDERFARLLMSGEYDWAEIQEAVRQAQEHERGLEAFPFFGNLTRVPRGNAGWVPADGQPQAGSPDGDGFVLTSGF